MRGNKNTDGRVCMSLFLSVCKWEVAFDCLSIIIITKKKMKEHQPCLPCISFFFFSEEKMRGYKNTPKTVFFFVVSLQRLFCFLTQKGKQNLRRCLSAPVLFPKTTGWKN